MFEPLSTSQGPAVTRTDQTSTTDRGGVWGPDTAPAVVRYVRPSLCELCVPVIRVVDSYFETITEAAHEPGCPNHPSNYTQTFKEFPKW